MADIALMHDLLVALGIAHYSDRGGKGPLAGLWIFMAPSFPSHAGERAEDCTSPDLPVLITCTTTSIAKMLFSVIAGARAFDARLIPAPGHMVIASWIAGLVALQIF
ncbi:MAG: hypothetical protein KGJ57_22440 [Sphingomonadales bacterium]|nr:hypothetical protein [Sphingomonadales bacterium]MDE2172144.1 hypothetical protein [Sphingomonadales bacterium]